MSAFLLPQYIVDRPVTITCKACGCSAVLPAEVADYHETCAECKSADFRINRRCRAQKVFARLSAPGYMDCTEWQGPYHNVFRAARDLSRTYDVHPRTGGLLEY